MRAMVLCKQREKLILSDMPIPEINQNEVLIKVEACGICRTDLHILDGELNEPKLPLVMGHQIVGTIVKKGKNVTGFMIGDRVGVPWLGYSCQRCKFCRTKRENLCDKARYTGYNIDGGFAEYTKANHRFIFRIPKRFDPLSAAPLLCAGLIGFRAYNMTRDAENLGIYGFGSAAHILIQLAIYEKKRVFTFSRRGDKRSINFAKKLGAVWSGYSDELPPEKLDGAIIFAPAGELIISALRSVNKGGKVICGGIHMSDIPSFPYRLLWEERMIKSVANLTREDGVEFFKLAQKSGVKTEINIYRLEDTNMALDDLRNGRFIGSAVIKI
ncbi:MAG: zinc-dependent alcohol dehydrogenase family protein [Myxococcota bacterium]